MSTFIIDVPMPAMGATVSELTIINIVATAGAWVTKGQKLAELESDKSAFDFESPADGKIISVQGNKGDVKSSGQPLFRMETSDASLKHLEVAGAAPAASAAPTDPAAPAASAKALVWTPRALKVAQEAGLDHAAVTDIGATGPGGRVSGDDVTKYLASRT
ncbi:MAG: biotin/lipoyl-containing protein [Candidatus Didemnitutus sp.]|nr:biotin/lipoyl-containing protein [Candidatus Didemnitutus sp.]